MKDEWEIIEDKWGQKYMQRPKRRRSCTLHSLVNWLAWKLRIGWQYQGTYPSGHGCWASIWENKKTKELREHRFLD